MKPTASPRTRRGQVIVLFAAVALPAVLAILALTVDLGSVMVTKARLQNAADSACLAAAQVLAGQRAAGEDEAVARARATSEAVAMQQANCDGADLSVEFGTLDTQGNFAVVGVEAPATCVRVVAARNGDSPGGPLSFVFAPLLGINNTDIQGSATAQVATHIRGVLHGLSPFAVPESRLVPPGQEMTFYPAGDDDSPGNGKGQDKVAPGNWGLLNLDGGNHATPELREWILYGYDRPLVLGEDGHLWIDGTPGFRCTLRQEIEERMGEVMPMVIYDEVTGQGSNAVYRCVGFLYATITSCDLTGGPGAHVTCRVEEVTSAHEVVTGGGMASPNMLKIQLVD